MQATSVNQPLICWSAANSAVMSQPTPNAKHLDEATGMQVLEARYGACLFGGSSDAHSARASLVIVKAHGRPSSTCCCIVSSSSSSSGTGPGTAWPSAHPPRTLKAPCQPLTRVCIASRTGTEQHSEATIVRNEKRMLHGRRAGHLEQMKVDAALHLSFGSCCMEVIHLPWHEPFGQMQTRIITCLQGHPLWPFSLGIPSSNFKTPCLHKDITMITDAQL